MGTTEKSKVTLLIPTVLRDAAREEQVSMSGALTATLRTRLGHRTLEEKS